MKTIHGEEPQAIIHRGRPCIDHPSRSGWQHELHPNRIHKGTTTFSWCRFVASSVCLSSSVSCFALWFCCFVLFFVLLCFALFLFVLHLDFVLALFLKFQLVADLFSLSSAVFFFWPSFNYALVYVFVINVAGSVFNKAPLVDFRRCIAWSYGLCCFELRFMIVAGMTYFILFFRCTYLACLSLGPWLAPSL